MAGYSEKSLVDKLGYKPNETIYLLSAPEWFKDYLNEENIQTSALPADWAHGFFESQDQLVQFLASINLSDIKKGLWVSWPKKTSGVKTDLAEQTLRDLILPIGWVDVKVAAIDETWSGLKFLRRKTKQS